MSSETGNNESTSNLTAMPASATTTASHHYRCPVCSATYQNELIARIHMTRLDDADHSTHNGLMPEAEIEVVDKTDSVVDTVSRHPTEMDPTAVTIEDLPSDLSAVNKHIVLTAIHNPETRVKTKIAELVEERLADEPLQVPPYRTVAAVLTRVFDPAREKTTKGDELAALTHKQQAVVIAHLAAPDATKTDLADMTGTSTNHPRYVLDRAAHVVEDLKTTLQDAGGDLIAVLTDELSARAVDALIDQGLLSDVPVDTDALRATCEGGDSSADSGLSDDDSMNSDSDELTAQSEDLSRWGSPAEESTGLSAAPGVGTLPEADSTTSPKTQTNCPETSETQQPASGNVDLDERTQTTPDAQISRTDIKKLKQQVAFTRSTLDKTEAPNTDLAVSLAEQIEAFCDALLVAQTDAE